MRRHYAFNSRGVLCSIGVEKVTPKRVYLNDYFGASGHLKVLPREVYSSSEEEAVAAHRVDLTHQLDFTEKRAEKLRANLELLSSGEYARLEKP